MHPAIHILSLMSIISLTLGSLTGCGERRLHVATVSGSPGQEVALEPIDENLQAQGSGLGNESIDESALSSQIPDGEPVSAEPINEDGSSDSSLTDPMTSGWIRACLMFFRSVSLAKK